MALSLLGLAVFLAWQALALRSFIRADARPPAWDQAIHMEIALDYRNALKAGRWEDLLTLAPKPGMPPFPPLYHLGLMLFYDDSDPAHAALWVNWFYLALLSLSLFAVSYEFRPDETALAAVIIFGCSPAAQGLLTTQLIDLPVVACAAAAYWALLRSEEFSRWGASLAFGLLFAAGMMHKWSFFSYMLPAYYLGLKGLGRPGSRFKALAAAFLALAGSAPWYLVHLPMLLPRLVQASSDFAVPVWRGGAFLNYFWASSAALGPPFWILAWISLLVPQYRRNWQKGWVIPVWVLSSYVFWSIVPNRQMRFLLPGLPGLAVALCGTWPGPVLWSLAAFQLFAGANFSAGWISPLRIPFPLHPLVFLPSEPPAREDWKIAEILREAQRRHEPDSAVANLTLVANAPYFNGPNFTWTDKRLGLPNVRIRGVNRRLCEFSEFVVLKNGKLGPPQVISGLPEASGLILEKNGWFSRAYEEAGRWPLPDRTEAVLYQRRRLSAAPFKDRAVGFQYYESGPFTAAGFKADLGRWDPGISAYPRVKASAAEAQLRGLRMTGLSIEMENALFVPAGETTGPGAWNELRFLKMGRLKIKSVRLEAEDLRSFLESRVKGLRIEKLELDRTARLEGRLGPLALSAEAEIRIQDSPRSLRFELLGARLGVTPLPLWLIRPFKILTVSLEPNPETPFAIDLAGLAVKEGRITVP